MNRLRRVLVVLLLSAVVVGVCFGLMVLAAHRLRVARQRVHVTISKATTVLTEPLRKDGYVDYLAALNLRASEGVTPENNAAELYWQAMGPGEIAPDHRDRFFKMLKMPPPPEQGDYFVSLGTHVERLQAAQDPRIVSLTATAADPSASGTAPPTSAPDLSSVIYDQQTAAMERPWSKEEFPLVAEWLAANKKPLGLLVEASNRPRWYSPMLCGNSDEGKLAGASFPHISSYREVARALVARAMFRLKLGKLDECCEDLLACHRLARLLGQGPSSVDGLSAYGVDGVARFGDRALLAHASLTAAKAAAMRAALAKLPSPPDMIDRIDVSERFEFLDAVSTAAREGVGGLSWLAPQTANMLPSLDWDLVLRNGNYWFDRAVAAGRQPTRSTRFSEAAQLNGEMAELEKDHREWQARYRAWESLANHGESSDDDRDDDRIVSIDDWKQRNVASKLRLAALILDRPSERIGNGLICNLGSETSLALQTEDRAAMDAGLIELGYTLAEYRADRGSYPQTLGELSPRYLTRIPVDIFAGDTPLHYSRQGAGYLLYSVGPNGSDDGGHSIDEGNKAGERWDDLPIRVPK